MDVSRFDGNCRFCAVGSGEFHHGATDVPFAQNDTGFAIASIGPLVEGWSLVVPRNHCFSLSELYGQHSFADFVRLTIRRIESRYGRTVIFEHGANRSGSATSCGTDHAHLHVVPTDISLVALANSSSVGPWVRARADDIKDIVGKSEYLFVSEEPLATEMAGMLHVLQTPTSQFFRKLIASYLGATQIADYRTHLLLDVAERARQRLVANG